MITMSRKARLAIGMSLGMSVVAGATIVLIATTSSDLIHACVRSGGAIRIVGDPGVCNPAETPLTWNQQGVPGERGPQGPQGEEGPPGTTATSHVFFNGFSIGIGTGGQGVLLGFRNELTPVLTLQLPAGAYTVDARLDFTFSTTRDASAQIHCSLPGNAGTFFFLDSSERPGKLQSSASTQREITTAINHPGGALTLTCSASSFESVGTTVQNATLLATPVGAINPN